WTLSLAPLASRTATSAWCPCLRWLVANVFAVRRIGVFMFEAFAKHTTEYLARGTELCAAVLIGLAALRATVKALRVYFIRGNPDLNDETVRLELGRWLALGLEFELAADI